VPASSARKRALVATYVPVTYSRPSRQVRWLEAAGYQVDVLSREPDHPDATGTAFRIGAPALPLRLAAYAMLPSRLRHRYLLESRIPDGVVPPLEAKYDVVVLHDLDFLPWVSKRRGELTDGPVLVDLHEYFASQGIGFVYRLLFARYGRWLLGFIKDPAITIRTTVADGIADLYADRLGVPRPVVIRSAARYADLEPSPVDDARIMLLHHGKADLGRGQKLLLDAFHRLDDRFRLVLMLVGSDREISILRGHPAVASGRVEFRPPVTMVDVPGAINDCDVEIIFFPPKTENLLHALPNKFFEALQGRLGLVIGRSPEMLRIVDEIGNGVVVPDWTEDSLAATLNGLGGDQVRELKAASHRAAGRYSDEREGAAFLALIQGASTSATVPEEGGCASGL